ncbi:MAG: hypothetical protein G01um101419_636 [Parcubacteria group bacterium Gr01-1014_19]|nr:MAG: hypothetical protein G01um101419_636 [Parcubacteria group bacterium Gr01-1014_19]
MGDESSTSSVSNPEESVSAPKIEVEKGGIRSWFNNNLPNILVPLAIVGILAALLLPAIFAAKKHISDSEKLPAAIEAAKQKPVIRLEDWNQLSKYRDHEIRDVLPGSDGDSVILVFDDCDYSTCGVERIDKQFLSSGLFQKDATFQSSSLSNWAPQEKARKDNEEMRRRLIAEYTAEHQGDSMITFTELLIYDGCFLEWFSAETGFCQVAVPGKGPKIIKLDLDWIAVCYSSRGYKIDCEKIFNEIRAKENAKFYEGLRRAKLEEEAKYLDGRRQAELQAETEK